MINLLQLVPEPLLFYAIIVDKYLSSSILLILFFILPFILFFIYGALFKKINKNIPQNNLFIKVATWSSLFPVLIILTQIRLPLFYSVAYIGIFLFVYILPLFLLVSLMFLYRKIYIWYKYRLLSLSAFITNLVVLFLINFLIFNLIILVYALINIGT